jgi:hypothetical protein
MSETDDNALDAAVNAANGFPPLPDMPPEALAPAIKEPTLAERFAAAPPVEDVSTPVKRGRGRPPGSKNKSTLAREAQEGVRQAPSQRMVTPPPKPPKPTDELTPQQRAQAKLDRAAELSSKVADTINDNLLLLLMSMGVPEQLIYNPGMAPARVQENSKYTELAQGITLTPMQANIIGRFLAELEATDAGGKIGAVATDGKGPLIIYGVLSFAAAIQYGKTLKDTYDKLAPLLEAHRASLLIQQQHQDTGGM